MNVKEAIELWYGCDTIESLSQHQLADMLNALVSRVEELEAAPPAVRRILAKKGDKNDFTYKTLANNKRCS